MKSRQDKDRDRALKLIAELTAIIGRLDTPPQAQPVARIHAVPRPSDDGDRLLSVAEALRALGIGRTSLYQLIANGDLQTVQIGRRRMIPSQAIADYISRAG